MFTYLNDGPNACRYEHQQAGLLIKQIEKNHDGAETSPEHYGTQNPQIRDCTVYTPSIKWTNQGFIFHKCFLPALLDIPTMLFFCFQKLMSFLKARKSKRS